MHICHIFFLFLQKICFEKNDAIVTKCMHFAIVLCEVMKKHLSPIHKGKTKKNALEKYKWEKNLVETIELGSCMLFLYYH